MSDNKERQQPTKPPLLDLRLARATRDAETRAAILAAAAAILSADGPSAMTVRNVARAVNASTKVVYTHFGGKDGLFDALYRRSFAGLSAALEDCERVDDGSERLVAMTTAYRRYALAEPAAYQVMFGDLGRAYEAPAGSRRMAWTSFETLRRTVAACLPDDREGDEGRVTRLLWAMMHGAVSLELRQLLARPDDAERLFGAGVYALLTGCGIAL